jgi:uncharacterized membrane protein YeaQ/YmgE (transglycosylase-associated protein family)
MNFIMSIIFGALVGWLSSIIIKTNSSQGLLGDVLLGIVGSIVGGLIFNYFGQPGVNGFNLYSLLVGVIGSIVFVAIGKAVMRMIA